MPCKICLLSCSCKVIGRTKPKFARKIFFPSPFCSPVCCSANAFQLATLVCVIFLLLHADCVDVICRKNRVHNFLFYTKKKGNTENNKFAFAALVKNEKLHTCIHVIARLQYVHRDKCTNSYTLWPSSLLCSAKVESQEANRKKKETNML